MARPKTMLFHGRLFRATFFGICLAISGCGDVPPEMSADGGARFGPAKQCSHFTETKQALFGDLHVHTRFSFDASAYGVQTTPDDAYNFAKGETIPFLPLDESGKMSGRIQIDRPLDFLAVTDHAEFLGETQICSNPGSSGYDTPHCEGIRRGGFDAIRQVATALALEKPQRISPVCPQSDAYCLQASSIPWKKIIAAAERANDTSSACAFTSLIGYEYSGSPSSSNYHRNVIFRGHKVPEIPVSRFEAPLDYDLWMQLDETCKVEQGCDYLTIPHNSNLSNGKLLAPYADLQPTKENKIKYAQKRLTREPLMEVFQHKGNSECANGFPDVLGGVDELCEMEQIRRIGKPGKTGRVFIKDGKLAYTQPQDNPTRYCAEGEIGYGAMQGNGCLSSNDFYRSALLTGMQEENEIGFNAIKLGASASTDTHMATSGAVKEDEWRGHIYAEWNKDGRLLTPGFIPSGKDGNPGGLTGVWATQNAREAIFVALRSRETFGTSGPRIKPRFFGGWDLPASLCGQTDKVSEAYRLGVPMGSDLSAPPRAGAKLTFLVMALADAAADATPLQKLQIIKGWVDASGKKHAEVLHAAGDAQPRGGVDKATGKKFGAGHQYLCGVYEDKHFDPNLSTYYYMRAVENPSPRWSLVDCLSYPDDKRPDVCEDPKISAVIQEQAWTSPIWYSKKR